MKHPYEILQKEYAGLLAGCSIDAGRRVEVDRVCDRALKHLGEYRAIEAATTVRAVVVIGCHNRESGLDFTRSLAQGDPWDRVSTHVPAHLGPYPSFVAAAEEALHIDRLDAVARLPGGWSRERALYEWELYNGFGPRNHGCHTGYLWAGTSVYRGGKYVADGVWDPHAIDRQLGTVPVMLRLFQLEPSLILQPALPTVTAPTLVPSAQPVPAGVGGVVLEHDVRWLQASLNALGYRPPLKVDGSYGRRTHAAVVSYQRAFHLDVDGIAGPETISAIEAHLKTVPATAAGVH